MSAADRAPPSRRVWFALVLLTLGALGARWRGIDWLLPVIHLDGSVILKQVQVLRAGGEAGAEEMRYYPHLLARSIALLPDPGRREPRPGVTTEEHVALASARWLQARQVSAVWSVVLVPATFLLAVHFLTPGWALFAAALVATSLLHAVFGTQVRPHGVASSCILLSVVASLRLRERGDRSSFALAGLAAGLALGALHYGVFALPPLALAFVLRRRRASPLWILVSLAIVAGFVRWLYPFHFGGASAFLGLVEVGGERALNLSGQPLLLEKFDGSGFPVVTETLWSYDPTILLLALVGGLSLARHARSALPRDPGGRARLAIVLAHALPYLLVIGMYQQTWERFVMQLLPYGACLGAVGVAWLGAGAARAARRFPGRGPLAAGSVALLALALPAAGILWLGTVRAAPSTYDQTAGWVRSHLRPAPDRMLLLTHDLPLLHAARELRENRPRRGYSLWVRYQLKLTPQETAGLPRFALLLPAGSPVEVERRLRQQPLAYLREQGVGYVLVRQTEPGTGEHLAAVRAALGARGPPLWRTTSSRVDRGPALLRGIRIARPDPLRPYLWRLFASVRLGPTLEIYRIPGDAPHGGRR